MSDNIPFEIEEEIMKRLPVKSLIQFQSVSKAWKSLIDSPDFIKHYSGQQQYLLLGYYSDYHERKFVSVVNDDSFPQQKDYLALPDMFDYFKIIGCSHGLFCLYGSLPKDHEGTQSTVVICNPSIRKAVSVVVPNGMNETKIGFGVCRQTMDPKIVKITQIKRCLDIEILSCISCQVEVFTLSTAAWRSSNNNLPRTLIRFFGLQVAVDGCLYWLAADKIPMDGGFRIYKLIISFDMTSEEFREIKLPDTLARQSHLNLSMSKLRDSLLVLELDGDEMGSVAWMMEGGVSKLFTKLFIVNIPYSSIRGIRKNDESIVEFVYHHFRRWDDYHVRLFALYNPCSKQVKNIGISEFARAFFVDSYLETLLLVDQPDFTVYDNGKRFIESLKAES